jgi:hypothetical protein
MDAADFKSRMHQALVDKGLDGSLDGEKIFAQVNQMGMPNGEPLTLRTSEMMRKKLVNIVSDNTDAMTGKLNSKAKAARTVINELDKTDFVSIGQGNGNPNAMKPRNGGNQIVSGPGSVQLGQDALAQLKKSRAEYSALRTKVENNPILQGIEEGVAPEALVDKYFLSPNTKTASIEHVQDAVDLLSPKSKLALKNAVMDSARKAAGLNAEGIEEISNFTGRGLGTWLAKVSDHKLATILSPDEIKGLHDAARSSLREKAQPPGVAIFNSNTPAGLNNARYAARAMSKLTGAAAMSPFVGPMVDAAAGRWATNRAKDVGAVLGVPQRSQSGLKTALLTTGTGGALAAAGNLPAINLNFNQGDNSPDDYSAE